MDNVFIYILYNRSHISYYKIITKTGYGGYYENISNWISKNRYFTRVKVRF